MSILALGVGAGLGKFGQFVHFRKDFTPWFNLASTYIRPAVPCLWINLNSGGLVDSTTKHRGHNIIEQNDLYLGNVGVSALIETVHEKNQNFTIDSAESGDTCSLGFM